MKPHPTPGSPWSQRNAESDQGPSSGYYSGRSNRPDSMQTMRTTRSVSIRTGTTSPTVGSFYRLPPHHIGTLSLTPGNRASRLSCFPLLIKVTIGRFLTIPHLVAPPLGVLRDHRNIRARPDQIIQFAGPVSLHKHGVLVDAFDDVLPIIFGIYLCGS
jgi:hypothetical protein